MKRTLIGLAALLSASLACAAEPDAPAAPAWIAALRTTDAIHATFHEERQLPIRREPLELTGELRFQTDLGLSLHYLTPEERTLIVDEKGVALRDDRGRTRRAPAGSKATQSAAVLLDILRFDFATLAEDFEIVAPEPAADGSWTLTFTPTPAGQRRGLQHVEVNGHGTSVDHLTLAAGSAEQIDITIDRTDRSTAFAAEEIERYFR